MAKGNGSLVLQPEITEIPIPELEERIAAMIFDHPENGEEDMLGEEACADLGRKILYEVLRRFDRHYFMDWPDAKPREKTDGPDTRRSQSRA